MKETKDYIALANGNLKKAEILMHIDLNREINLPLGKPATLGELAKGQGKSARKARALLRKGHSPEAQINQ